LTALQNNRILTSSRDIENMKTLSSTFPHVLEALVKRMGRTERMKLLKEFEDTYPKEFGIWFKAEVKKYLESYGQT
jgi:hypothetical protein